MERKNSRTNFTTITEIIIYIIALVFLSALFLYIFPAILDFIVLSVQSRSFKFDEFNQSHILHIGIFSIVVVKVIIVYFIFKKFFNSNFKARIESYLYGIKSLEFKVATIGTLISTYLLYQLSDNVKLLSDNFKTPELIASIISFLIILYSTIKKIIIFNLDMYYLVDVSSVDDEIDTQEKLMFDEKEGLKKVLYVSKNDKEYFITSDKLNYLLYLDSTEVQLTKKSKIILNKNKYQIPKDVVMYAPFALKKKLRSPALLTNEKIVGQLTEITYNKKENKINDICVNKAKYFDTLLSNELAYKKVMDLKSTKNSFDGNILLLKDKNKLLNYEESYLVNHIGVNTIAISNDNYLIVNIQGRASNISANKFINSGSGSLKYYDFISNKKKSFTDIIKIGAERELLEECGLPRKTKLITEVIGFMKVLKYGGKPDYFAATLIDLTHKEIENYANKSVEIKNNLMQKPKIIKLKDNIEESIIAEINKLQAEANDLLNKEARVVSIQLNASKIMIENLLEKEVRVFENLKSKN